MAKNKRNRNTLSDNAEYDAIINALKEINKSALSEQKYYDNQPQKEPSGSDTKLSAIEDLLHSIKTDLQDRIRKKFAL